MGFYNNFLRKMDIHTQICLCINTHTHTHIYIHFFQAWMGFYNSFLRKMGWSKEQLVQEANDFALNVCMCADVPALEKKTIGKMGLKGVPGMCFVCICICVCGRTYVYMHVCMCAPVPALEKENRYAFM